MMLDDDDDDDHIRQTCLAPPAHLFYSLLGLEVIGAEREQQCGPVLEVVCGSYVT